MTRLKCAFCLKPMVYSYETLCIRVKPKGYKNNVQRCLCKDCFHALIRNNKWKVADFYEVHYKMTVELKKELK